MILLFALERAAELVLAGFVIGSAIWSEMPIVRIPEA
jgi:hypothetical protein